MEMTPATLVDVGSSRLIATFDKTFDRQSFAAKVQLIHASTRGLDKVDNGDMSLLLMVTNAVFVIVL